MEGHQQYQRAVTPTIVADSNSGLIRGKSLTYHQQPQGVSKRLSEKPPIAGNSSGRILSLGMNNRQSVLVSNILSTTPPSSAGTHAQRTTPRGNTIMGQSNALDNMHAQSTTSGSKHSESSDNAVTSSVPRYDLVPLSDDIPSDGIIFARIRNNPESLVVFRTPEERNKNPERLNLDRRQLDVCPILEYEQRLRLLNFQNNNIRVIQNLENLPNLIFLDLYNNKLSSLQGPLSNARGLRVLMAGKNRIAEISNVTNLKKLDVLDLHSNDIRIVDGLDGLTDLRVLNMAGNHISIVQNLSSLISLTELNLRRNSIEKVLELDKIPCLQRVFLSHNLITSVGDILCLFKIKMLIELSLDGNPMSELDPAKYRNVIVSGMPGLRHLDLKRITEEERAAAQVAFEVMTSSSYLTKGDDAFSFPDTNSSTGEGAESEILCPRKESGEKIMTMLSRAPSMSTSATSLDANCTEIDTEVTLDKNTYANDMNYTITPSMSSGAKAPVHDYDAYGHHGKSLSRSTPTSLLSRSSSNSNVEKSLFDVEIIGPNEKALVIIGSSWEWAQPKRLYSTVVEVSLFHITKDTILSKYCVNVSWLPAVRLMRLMNNDFTSVVDIEMIADIFPSTIEHLIIKDNPVSTEESCNLLRNFVICKYASLKTFNEREVTQSERASAVKSLQPIRVMHQLANQRRQQKLKEQSVSLSTRKVINSTPISGGANASNNHVVTNNCNTSRATQQVADDIAATFDQFIDMTSSMLRRRERAAAYNEAIDKAIQLIIIKSIE